jgi:hypothetical protein
VFPGRLRRVHVRFADDEYHELIIAADQVGLTPPGVSHSAAHRVIDTLGPLLALAPVLRRRVDQVSIVDRKDTVAYRSSGINQQLDGRPVLADGGYRGNPEIVIPYRQPTNGTTSPRWKEDLYAVHRSVRARVEHTLAQMKVWKLQARELLQRLRERARLRSIERVARNPYGTFRVDMDKRLDLVLPGSVPHPRTPADAA